MTDVALRETLEEARAFIEAVVEESDYSHVRQRGRQVVANISASLAPRPGSVGEREAVVAWLRGLAGTFITPPITARQEQTRG